MTDTKTTGERHSLRPSAGDTPALGLPVERGSGGKRWAAAAAATLDIDVEATADITVGDDVLWHDREAIVVEVYPAGQAWMRTLCKIEFDDGGPSVVVGRDELEPVRDGDALYFVNVPNPVLEDTAPLPSPVPRAEHWFDELNHEADPLDDEDQAPAPAAEEQTREFAVFSYDDVDMVEIVEGTLPVAARRSLWRRGVVDPLADLLAAMLVLLKLGPAAVVAFVRLVRKVSGWVVDQVEDGIEVAADWERWHSRLIAKVVLALLAAAILGAAGVLWVLR